MALIQRDFRKDKPEPLRVRIVCGVKISTIFEDREMKKIISLVLVLALALATEIAKADFIFGEPTNLGPTVNSGVGDWDPDLSTDGLSLFFGSNRPGGVGDADLWITTRPAIDDPWAEPVNLGPIVNGSFSEGDPSIPADGLSLYFSDWANPRPGGHGNYDIWVTTRKTTDDDWGPAVNLGPPFNTSYQDWSPNISADGLLLLFTSNRPGGSGGDDTWMTRRATRDDPWGPPVNLGSTVNSADLESDPSLSADGYTLYFGHGPAGGYSDLWQVSIEPIVDLNGDGNVDTEDMCIMVDHWGDNYPLCDIGPTPLGDGIVDVQDLTVLAEHLFEDVNDPTLVAHWALDEIEGDIASDSANDNDGTVYGDPAWQTEGGMVDGALQLDGIDDYVNTPFVLDPADGKFSVFVWIKGGAPGQAILSQMGGSNWLCTDSVEGNLMTEIKAYGRGATGPLLSQTVITDGNWHRIGLVWDGSERTLYVDDIAVAQDAQPDLEASENGLYIGTGMAMEAGSFWSGLIDDVRIYNRAITP